MKQDMTRGSITRTLVLFSIPLALSGLLQQLYNWVDALIVGNFAGEGALAAIGATGTVSGMLLAVVMGFSVGVSIVVSHAYGEGDHALIPKVAGSFAVLMGAASLVLSLAGVLLAAPFLRLLRTPADILDDAVRYLRIIFLGMPAMAVYNIYNAALRGIGDSATPLKAIAVSAVVNLALDLLLVAVIPLGVAGAAIATSLSQWMMTAYLIVTTPRRHPLLAFRFGRGAVDGPSIRRGLSLSVPTAAQSAVRSVGGLMLQNVMNGFGSLTVAAITTAYRIDSLILLPVNNIGAGVSTFAAQNAGSGDMDRARKGLRAGMAVAFLTSLVTTAVIVLLGGTLLALFGISPEAVAIGRDFLSFCGVFYPVFGLQCALIGYLQGVGDVRFAAFVTISGLAIRVAASYLFRGAAGNRIIAYSEMASWVYCLIVAGARYAYLGRKGAGRQVSGTGAAK